MRLNRFLALATGLSRRNADKAIESGNVMVNNQPALLGQVVSTQDTVSLGGRTLTLERGLQTILLNKPIGYVCSRNGQGSRTIYELLPEELRHLKPIGRLDKDSSGLLLLTNDGELAHTLTHPRFHKVKRYEVTLDKPLQPSDRREITDKGVRLPDGPSKLILEELRRGSHTAWGVTMHEGRNRQIRRTFAALGYVVTSLHRTHFGSYALGDIRPGSYKPA